MGDATIVSSPACYVETPGDCRILLKSDQINDTVEAVLCVMEDSLTASLERSDGAESAAYQAAGSTVAETTSFPSLLNCDESWALQSHSQKKKLPLVTTHAANRGVDLSSASKDMLMFFTGGNGDEADRYLRSPGQEALKRQSSMTAFVKPELRRHVSRGRRQVFTLRVTAKTAQYVMQKTVVFEMTNKTNRPFRFL